MNFSSVEISPQSESELVNVVLHDIRVCGHSVYIFMRCSLETVLRDMLELYTTWHPEIMNKECQCLDFMDNLLSQV